MLLQIYIFIEFLTIIELLIFLCYENNNKSLHYDLVIFENTNM